ncbi:hypothetical protein VTP01DRAFT_6384 [Rhizomucor pusillus]|uniref:uncharacterized protein n=1 Tax=Rhizomucor pusillus TaxID=4840 RepID=UPI0037434D2F
MPPRDLPCDRLTTESAKETSMIARSHYGATQGPPNSPAREQQCYEFIWANYYAFRCCPSYRNDQSKWSRWFCDLDENKENLKAVRLQMQVEDVAICIPDVRPSTIYYLLHQCQPPAGYDHNDKTWLLDATNGKER